MSGRRIAPTPFFFANAVVRDGRLYIGTDPWADCSWCGTVRDTFEFDGCPICVAEAHLAGFGVGSIVPTIEES